MREIYIHEERQKEFMRQADKHRLVKAVVEAQGRNRRIVALRRIPERAWAVRQLVLPVMLQAGRAVDLNKTEELPAVPDFGR